MSWTSRFTHLRGDRKPDSSSQKDRRLPEPPTRIKPLGRKVGEGAGNLRSREDAFKRRHGTTKS